MPSTAVELEPVPRADWREFCEAFGRSHRGWLVTVSRVDTKKLLAGRERALAGAETLCREQALHEVDDATTGESADSLLIAVMAGEDETWIMVDQVTALFDERVSGGDFGLRMDCADGTTTLLEFRVGADPETLDGLGVDEL